MTAQNKTLHPFSLGLAACLLFATQATQVSAQLGHVALLQDDAFCGDCCDHDLQLFAPTEFDFDCQPIQKDCGWYFGYDKLSWGFPNESVTLGTNNTTTASTNPWRVFNSGGEIVLVDPTDPDGDVVFIPGTTINIDPPNLPTAIRSAVPRADFAWGERYEFGYSNGESGWLMSILDGPEQNANAIFGFGYTPQDDTVTGVGLPSDIPNNPFNQLLSPLGSVLIVFDDPQLLMRGFLDVADGNVIGVPGGVLEGDSNGDGVLDGDGFADDIDEDGQHGPDGIDTEDPGDIPDRLGAIPADFDDLVILPTSFRQVFVRNRTELQGIELMHTVNLSNRHRMAKHQNIQTTISYGVRYLRFDDNFIVNGEGGVLGDSFWDTQLTNNLVGPQIAFKWSLQKSRIRYDVNSRVMFAYNALEWEQTSALGEDLIPGQHNHPLYFPPTYSHHGKRTDDFSPLVEFRGQASYQLTSAIAVKLGYNATFIDNIRRASEQVKYELPSMGFIDGGTQEIFVSGVNLGFDVVY